MKIKAGSMHFQELNEALRSCTETEIEIDECCGQRYIGSGMSGKKISIGGVPGNALGAYLDGGRIAVFGNAQDATGDTMNDGEIIIHGSSGDATGYAMRGGKIFVKGDVGYRAGIHMKAYREKVPMLIIGGKAGSFLGEYQAGGVIIVLGIDTNEPPVGNFCGTGMHGGSIYIRADKMPSSLPKQIIAKQATTEDMQEIMPALKEYCQVFDLSLSELLFKNFYLLKPDNKNPYLQLYTHN